ncbi:MAG: hypothetical protein U9R46_00395 [Bacteroidota bacterium]|nr:hypothetical protein [Bacteroidota bacterium]
MKNFTVKLFFSVVISTALLLFSCTQKSVNITKDDQKGSDKATINNTIARPTTNAATLALLNKITDDPDWQIIASANTMVMQKFLDKKINVDNLDLSDEKTLLSIIDIDKITYRKLSEQVKAAGIRFQEKLIALGLTPNSNYNCISCTKSENEQISEYKIMVKNFQQNPERFKNFQQKSLRLKSPAFQIKTNLVDPSQDPSNSLCCSLDFYICCGVCSATIPGFLTYLACCYLCGRSFCCPDFK